MFDSWPLYEKSNKRKLKMKYGWSLWYGPELRTQIVEVGDMRYCYINRNVVCGEILNVKPNGTCETKVLSAVKLRSDVQTLNEIENIRYIGKKITLEDFKKYAPLTIQRYRLQIKNDCLKLATWADQFHQEALTVCGYQLKETPIWNA